MTRFIIGILVMVMTATTAGATDAQFDAMWHDGRAELDGYRIEVSRYGQVRKGTAILVYVTEPFSESKRVKVDDPAHNPGDTFNALKLNLVRDFQTGIYDYNTMVSVFVRADDFSPAKISFSSAEWCGHVYSELLFNEKDITGHYFSYFENESGPLEMRRVPGGIAEDNLFILLRGLRDDYLAPGATKKVKLLPSTYFSRLTHTIPRWVDTNITRRAKAQTIDVPAGRFKVMVYDVKTADEREGTFYIEEAYPHRIVTWDMLPDVSAVLTGSTRLPYWQLNRNGHESHLRELGLDSE